ncbi:MAG: site-specific DNA-methyltransferase [Verrucomicrobiales bacterium]|nr:site-specific DNA-methyltransferase [Verrucomicrobiales bacterium]MCP5528247.1 site-specific DNA-methyltransferase [Verrucomicrobiales bacterium]
MKKRSQPRVQELAREYSAGLPEPLFRTVMGAAWLGKAEDLLPRIPDESVNLIFTSPPYALHFKKEYGNADQHRYVEWLLGYARHLRRLLREDGSLVINIGGSWQPGNPVRSLCHFEILLELVRQHGFHLAQEFYWYNPAKLPAPAEWVTVRRIRVKDAVECLWWMSKTPRPKADNRRILAPYSADMKRLLKRGYRAKERPSGHRITHKFTEQEGSIPPNLLTLGNNDSNGYYLRRCSEAGLKPHPARFPVQLPEHFIKFLTDDNDVVLDPFAGSCTTGQAAERLRRRWLCFETRSAYLEGAKFRFETGGLHEPVTDNSQANGTERRRGPRQAELRL